MEIQLKKIKNFFDCNKPTHSIAEIFYSVQGEGIHVGAPSVFLRMFEEYKIGISSGVRGEPVKTFEEVYSSEEACEHDIFLKRNSDLMEQSR